MALDANDKREFKVVGQRLPRPDGVDKVTGRALYGADTTAPGMLHAAICAAPTPMLKSPLLRSPRR